ncbi:cbb3-type cytochrome c oxidase subunit 3 [Salibaculum sp.]|uniref:cbb3-type cytochrome c oxidase subunit 3 n=1 Tax=Salibaculum sp. TaxID=2855480 RepID=UPI002B4A2727|nr:cbb3-type cytochrome c oxidase subunit 3 [Salibaculum sp.]HKL69522.1 cbb3-type cytochrome c oxidase subunit 3 [Salibaculum sp.]
METYSLLRHFADSWMLLALFIFFIGTWFWAFRPGSRPVHDDAANSIFRNEDAPADEDGDRSQDNNTDPEGQK